MALIDVTKPPALDETLQGTNDILATLGKDVSLQAIATALSTLGLTSVGDLSQLTTEQKTSLVAAINEINGDLDNYVQKSNTPGLLKNDGTVDTNDYAEKVSSATNGNLAGLNGSGNLTDSGWNGAKDTTSISGNPISISGLKANQLAVNPIITLEPIQAGSGTPSPSNIRAISGYDKVEVLSCGKNLFDINKVLVGTVSGNAWAISSSALATKLYDVKFKTNTSYTFSGTELQSAANLNTRLIIYYTDGTRDDLFTDRGTTAQSFSFTSNASKTVSYLSLTYGTSGGTVTITNFQIEEGSSATAYVPYDKTTSISESLGQTVYGGTLDVRTGELTSELNFYTFDGTEGWTINGNNAYHVQSDMKVGFNMTGYCSKLEVKSDTGCLYLGNNNNSIYLIGISNLGLSTVSDIQNFVNGMQIAYPKATPTEIQLTPHEISLLKDYAYASTNGTNIALDYHNGELASLADVSQLGETVNKGLEFWKTEDSWQIFNSTQLGVSGVTLYAHGAMRILTINQTPTGSSEGLITTLSAEHRPPHDVGAMALVQYGSEWRTGMVSALPNGKVTSIIFTPNTSTLNYANNTTIYRSQIVYYV